MNIRRRSFSSFLATWLLAGCGGGGGTATPPVTATPTGDTTATFQLGALPAAVRSAAFVFTGGQITAASLPGTCPASPTCAITVPAPAGRSVSAYRVYVYPTTNGSGTALEIATGDISLYSGQNTQTTVRFYPVVDSYTLALSPASITPGIATTIDINEIAKDVTGKILAFPYVATSDQYASFQITDALSDGTTTMPPDGGSSFIYSGIGPYPVAFTSNLLGVLGNGVPIAGYAPVKASLTVHPAVGPVGYALAPNVTDLYLPGATTLARSYAIQYGNAAFVRFDPSGTVWVQNVQGTDPEFANADAFILGGVTAQNAAASPITMPTGDSLLDFDATGRLYVANPGASTGQPVVGQPSIYVYSVGASSALSLLRSVPLSAPACSAAADAAGRLYVSACGVASGVAEYLPGSGSAAASNASASAPVAVDPSGDVFATYGAAIGEWPAGTFGAASPLRTFAGLPCPPADLAVDKTGNIYALTGPACSGGNNLYYYPVGSASPTLLQRFSNAYNAIYSGQHSIATPLK